MARKIQSWHMEIFILIYLIVAVGYHLHLYNIYHGTPGVAKSLNKMEKLIKVINEIEN